MAATIPAPLASIPLCLHDAIVKCIAAYILLGEARRYPVAASTIMLQPGTLAFQDIVSGDEDEEEEGTPLWSALVHAARSAVETLCPNVPYGAFFPPLPPHITDDVLYLSNALQSALFPHGISITLIKVRQDGTLCVTRPPQDAAQRLTHHIVVVWDAGAQCLLQWRRVDGHFGRRADEEQFWCPFAHATPWWE